MLAEALSERLPQGLDAVFFASTGAEAVDSAMKFARAATRPAAADLLRQQLSRRHARAAVAGRRRVLQGGLRPAAARLRARSVRRPRAPGGGAAREGRRRLHRRADPGPHGDPPARGLSAGRAGAVPALRDDVRRRRDPDRARTHRQVVRARALGTRAGLRARRQGAQRRLHAGRRDGHEPRDLPEGRGNARALLRASVDVRPQSPVDGGGPGHAAHHRARRPRRARRAHEHACCATGSPSCSSATR